MTFEQESGRNQDSNVKFAPLVVFAICSNCGQASESRDPALNRLMEQLARQQGFKVQATTMELSGLCEACTHGS